MRLKVIMIIIIHKPCHNFMKVTYPAAWPPSWAFSTSSMSNINRFYARRPSGFFIQLRLVQDVILQFSCIVYRCTNFSSDFFQLLLMEMSHLCWWCRWTSIYGFVTLCSEQCSVLETAGTHRNWIPLDVEKAFTSLRTYIDLKDFPLQLLLELICAILKELYNMEWMNYGEIKIRIAMVRNSKTLWKFRQHCLSI